MLSDNVCWYDSIVVYEYVCIILIMVVYVFVVVVVLVTVVFIIDKVTTMFRKFVNAQAFNQDIGAWNTSKVTIYSYLYICRE